MYVQCTLNISQSVYNSQGAPIVRPLVRGMGIFVSFKCDWGFALEAAVLCTMLLYILPRYIESLLYLFQPDCVVTGAHDFDIIECIILV